MDTASVGQGGAAVAPAITAVLGGDTASRRRAIALLGAAGFSVSDRPGLGPLTVLLGEPDEVARLREIRLAAKAQPDVPILAVMPADARNPLMRRAVVAGASGIVLDGQLERALVPTAHAVLAGQLAVPDSLGRQIAPRPLSHREKQIIGLVVLGLTNREIAGKLYLAESTVKTHLASAFRKLDARSRSEAVARIQDPETGYGLAVLEAASPGMHLTAA